VAFLAKLAADGQLATSTAAIYTVPTNTAAYVRTMKFHNTNAATQTVNLFINGSGTNRKTYRFQLLQNDTAVVDDAYTLEAGDSIQADTTTASAVDFSIHGVEES